MGAFFLTNDLTESIESRVLSQFRLRGQEKYTRLDFKNNRLLYYFPKTMASCQHIARSGEDVVVGIGTFFYNGKHGEDALLLILEDYRKNGNEIFGNVLGHFNFVLYISGAVLVVTDKSGTYHSFYGNKGETWYVSSSFFAVCQSLDRLTPLRQSLFEFLHSEAVYGGSTFFKEINYLPFGSVLSLGSQNTHEKYIDWNLSFTNTVTLEEYFEYVKSKLSFLKDIPLRMICDLSAGYDTRNVAALLKSLKVPHIYNTNENSEDARDSGIACMIAKKESREIVLMKKHLGSQDYDLLLKKSFYIQENGRDAFRSVYAPVFYEEKANSGELVYSGYGGELFREKKYKGIENISELIDRQFRDKSLKTGYAEYKSELALKMEAATRSIDSIKETIEHIYCHIRMAYWGGARINAFNQYCYNYHPLFDYTILKPVLAIGADEKDEGAFQKKFIEMCDPVLARYPSQYGYNFVKSHKPIWAKKILKVINELMQLPQNAKRWKNKNLWNSKQDIQKYAKFGIDILNSPCTRSLSLDVESMSRNTLGRLATIEKISETFNTVIWD